MDKNKNKTNSRSVKKSFKSNSNNCENSLQQKVKRNKDKKHQKSKREKYSTNATQTVFRDLRSSATRSLTNVRNTFDNLSQRLKLSSIQNQEPVNRSDEKSYQQLGNSRTPTQLYSPFGIETPSPGLGRKHGKRSCCRQMFFSPTGKIKDDIKYLTNGINELNIITEQMENQFLPRN